MLRPIPWARDLVPSLDVRATEKSFTIKFGSNKLLRTELPTILRLIRLFSEIRAFFYTALHKVLVQRALLKRSYQQPRGQIITITPTAWCILVLLSVVFPPLACAGIVMVFWLLATWLVLYASYEAAQITSRVTRRLLDGPVQTLISIIWDLTGRVQPVLVEGGGFVPLIQLMSPNTAERGLQGPPGYKQASPSGYKKPIPPSCKRPISPLIALPVSRGGTSPPYSATSSESGEDIYDNYGELPRPATLSPLPKARKRAVKAVMNRRVPKKN